MSSRSSLDLPVLKFRNFEEVEATLLCLGALYRNFVRRKDALGAARTIHEVQKGKRRAAMISKNQRVRIEKRREKAEMVLWFEIWLLSPEAFGTWLALRKRRMASKNAENGTPAPQSSAPLR